jgi:hypothetical protein
MTYSGDHSSTARSGPRGIPGDYGASPADFWPHHSLCSLAASFVTWGRPGPARAGAALATWPPPGAAEGTARGSQQQHSARLRGRRVPAQAVAPRRGHRERMAADAW